MENINKNNEVAQNITQDVNNHSNIKNNVMEKDSLYFAAILLRHKFLIIAIVLISTIASIIISLNMKNEYLATVSVVPPKTSGSLMEGALSSISSALRDFGMTKLSGKGEGSYSFLVILQSRSIADLIIKEFNLAERYDIVENRKSKAIRNNGEIGTAVRAAFSEHIEILFEKEGNFIINAWDENPQVAADIANRMVQLANEKALGMYRDEAFINRKYIEYRLASTDSTLSAISNRLVSYSDKKMLFSPLDQAKAMSAAYADLKSKSIENEIYYQLLKTSYGDKDPYTQYYKNLNTQLQAQLVKAERKPGFGGNFSMTEAAGIGIDYMKMYAEFETYTKVKSFLLPMLEQARLDEQRSVQSLFIVDDAVPADKKDRPKRSVIVLGAIFGSFVLSVLVVFLINGIRSFRIRYNEFIKSVN